MSSNHKVRWSVRPIWAPTWNWGVPAFNPNLNQSLGYSGKSGRSSSLNINNYRAEHCALAVPTRWNAVKHSYTSFLAISWSRLGKRLTLWLIARLRMCLGRVWNTRELEDFCETAFNMALISAARAWAKADTGMKEVHQIMTNSKKARGGYYM